MLLLIIKLDLKPFFVALCGNYDDILNYIYSSIMQHFKIAVTNEICELMKNL